MTILEQGLPTISDTEFSQRRLRACDLVLEAGLDAMLVHSNEAEMANVRYFSDYWPIFESAGVLIPAEGEPALLIGPESEHFARDRSRIPAIHMLTEYREPAEPDYPDIPVADIGTVIREHCGREPRRIGIGAWAVLPLPVWMSLQAAFPDAEFVPADDIMRQLRGVKSEAEVDCLRSAFTIAGKALEAVLDAMAPGRSERELVGIAQQVIYAEGAEYEGMPQYVFSGPNTVHAISRPTERRLQPGDMVQLNISARVGGYASGIGRPVVLGSMSAAQCELLTFGLEAHEWTCEHLQAGVQASQVASGYEAWVRARGYGANMLYGPCHGIGIIEVEAPWLETSSRYELTDGMCFQADTFFHAPEGDRLAAGGAFGLRWEDAVVVRDGGCERLYDKHLDLLCIS